MDIPSIIRSALEAGARIDEAGAGKLALFAANMLERGSLCGVTALKTEEDIFRELIFDSIAGQPLYSQAEFAADLGSGGGVPGIPLAIVCPHCRFVLIESQQRKCRWISEQIEALGLSGRVIAEPLRGEAAGRDKKYCGKFDIVSAKALAPLPSLIELSMPLLKKGGMLAAYKGVKLDEEIAASANALKIMNAEIAEVVKYSLDERERFICAVKKAGPPRGKFPRREGLAQHNPL